MASSATITQVPVRAPHGPQGRGWEPPTPPGTRAIPTDADEAYKEGWRDREQWRTHPRIPLGWVLVGLALVGGLVVLGAFVALLLHDIDAGANLDERMDAMEQSQADINDRLDTMNETLVTLLVKNSK